MTNEIHDGGQLGVEVEFRVIDRATFFESNQGNLLYPTNVDGKWLAPLASPTVHRPVAEMMRSVVEVVTEPLHLHQLRSALDDVYDLTSDQAAENGLSVISTSLSILPPIGGFTMTEALRYEEFVERYQDDARHLSSAGLHMHGTVLDPEVRQEVRNRMSSFEPLLCALSAGAPIHNGVVTGKASSRMSNYQRMPSVMDPPVATTSDEWLAFVTGSLSVLGESASDPLGRIHPFTRPSGSHPTCEYRSCDVGITRDYNQFLLVLMWGLHYSVLADVSAGRPSNPVPTHLIALGRYAASRHGVVAKLPNPFDGTLAPVRDIVRQTLGYISPALEAAGVLNEFRQQLSSVIDESSAGNTADRILALLDDVRREREYVDVRNPLHDLPACALSPSSLSTSDGALTVDECQRLTIKLVARSRAGTMFEHSSPAVAALERDLLGVMRSTTEHLTESDIVRLVTAMPADRPKIAADLGLIGQAV